MELIDNINRLLGDDLKQTLKPGSRLKVAECFSMYAFEALKAELEQVDERHFICWQADNAERSAMPVALHLGGLYEQLLRALLPLPARPNETLAEQVARLDAVAAKQREADQTAARLDNERQFNRKIAINGDLRRLQRELEALRR